MNRKTRFRCWDVAGKHFADGFTASFGVILAEMIMGAIDIVGRDNFDSKVSLQQWVGLQDKSGKRIYEGDILRWSHDSVNHTIVKVEYICDQDKNGFYIVDGNYTRQLAGHVAEKCEVIGNIFENPDLIKS